MRFYFPLMKFDLASSLVGTWLVVSSTDGESCMRKFCGFSPHVFVAKTNTKSATLITNGVDMCIGGTPKLRARVGTSNVTAS